MPLREATILALSTIVLGISGSGGAEEQLQGLTLIPIHNPSPSLRRFKPGSPATCTGCSEPTQAARSPGFRRSTPTYTVMPCRVGTCSLRRPTIHLLSAVARRTGARRIRRRRARSDSRWRAFTEGADLTFWAVAVWNGISPMPARVRAPGSDEVAEASMFYQVLSADEKQRGLNWVRG